MREEIKNNTELGKEAHGYMLAGKLVPDQLIFGMIEKTLDNPESKQVMFDGFPRNGDQAKKVSLFYANLC